MTVRIAKKHYGYLLIALLSVLILGKFYHHLTDDFRLSHIHYLIPFRKEWETHSSEKERQKVNEIIKGNFRYLGKGAQSYVFASEDDHYVIKFFKFKHLKPCFWLDWITEIPVIGPWRTRELARKKRQVESVFNGYHLAYTLSPQASGLVFAQFNPTHQKKEMILHDKLGWKRTVDLGETVYIIQEKGITLGSLLTQLINENKLEEAKQRLKEMAILYHEEYKKGLYDRDHAIMNNTGFIHGRAVRLDVGKLSHHDPLDEEFFQQDWKKVLQRIKEWFQKKFPKHEQEFVSYTHRGVQLTVKNN